MVEFLVFSLGASLAQRLGDRWLDATAANIDEGLRNLLRQLVSARSEDDPKVRARKTARVEIEVARYVEQHPESEQELAAVVRQPVVATSGDRRLARIEQYWALLMFVLDGVASLGRPVALRGFFNCETCLTLIDARVEGQDDLLLPEPPKSDPDYEPTIWLTSGSDAAGNALIGKPRVWLLRCPSDADRDRMADKLNRWFARPRHLLPSPELLQYALLLEDEPELILQPELVSHISSDWVWIETGVATSDPRHDLFYAIEHTRGAKLMREDLDDLLRARWESDEAWRQMLRMQ